jgi:hypothetical protein
METATLTAQAFRLVSGVPLSRFLHLMLNQVDGHLFITIQGLVAKSELLCAISDLVFEHPSEDRFSHPTSFRELVPQEYERPVKVWSRKNGNPRLGDPLISFSAPPTNLQK